MSRHSMHHSSHPRHEEDHDGTNNDRIEMQFGDQQQARKTFSYAAHARGDEVETAIRARAPSPPGTDTGATDSKLDEGEQHDNKRDNVFRKVKRKTFRFFHAMEG